MNKIFSAIEALARREASNPVITRTLHTVWEAAAGAGIAAISGTHGDVRDAVLVAVAAGLAALKSAVVSAVEGRSAAAPVTVADMVEVSRPVAPPAVAVTGVETPSTPVSPADASVVPPAAQ